MGWRLKANTRLALGGYSIIDDILERHLLRQLHLREDEIDLLIPCISGLMWEAVRLAGERADTIEQFIQIANQINWWWNGTECETENLIGCLRCRPFGEVRRKYFVAVSRYSYAYHSESACPSFHSDAEVYWGYQYEFDNYHPCEVCVVYIN